MYNSPYATAATLWLSMVFALSLKGVLPVPIPSRRSIGFNLKLGRSRTLYLKHIRQSVINSNPLYETMEQSGNVAFHFPCMIDCLKTQPYHQTNTRRNINKYR